MSQHQRSILLMMGLISLTWLVLLSLKPNYILILIFINHKSLGYPEKLKLDILRRILTLSLLKEAMASSPYFPRLKSAVTKRKLFAQG